MTVCSDETGQEGVTGRAGDAARGAPAHLSLGGICPARAWGTQAASPTNPGLGPGSASLAGRPGRVPQLSGPGLLSQQAPGTGPPCGHVSPQLPASPLALGHEDWFRHQQAWHMANE